MQQEKKERLNLSTLTFKCTFFFLFISNSFKRYYILITLSFIPHGTFKVSLRLKLI